MNDEGIPILLESNALEKVADSRMFRFKPVPFLTFFIIIYITYFRYSYFIFHGLVEFSSRLAFWPGPAAIG